MTRTPFIVAVSLFLLTLAASGVAAQDAPEDPPGGHTRAGGIVGIAGPVGLETGAACQVDPGGPPQCFLLPGEVDRPNPESDRVQAHGAARGSSGGSAFACGADASTSTGEEQERGITIDTACTAGTSVGGSTAECKDNARKQVAVGMDGTPDPADPEDPPAQGRCEVSTPAGGGAVNAPPSVGLPAPPSSAAALP